MPITMLDEKCRGAVAYRKLLTDQLVKELSVNPDRISPNAAALVSLESEKKKKKDSELEIVADDMGSMLG